MRSFSSSSFFSFSSPDLICQLLHAVIFAGLQPARFGAPWASPDFNRTSTARNKAISNAKENARKNAR
jgi:hypothetical protein